MQDTIRRRGIFRNTCRRNSRSLGRRHFRVCKIAQCLPTVLEQVSESVVVALEIVGIVLLHGGRNATMEISNDVVAAKRAMGVEREKEEKV